MKKNTITYLVLVLIGIGALVYFGTGNTFSLYNKAVYIPTYTSMECNPRTENLQLKSITTHNDNPVFYHCSASESGTYIPSVSGVQCEYIVSNYDTVDAYKCSGFVDSTTKLNTASCTNLYGFWKNLFDNKEPVTIPLQAGDTLYLNTGKTIGTARVQVRYPAYGLSVQLSSGYKNPVTTSCDIKSLSSTNYHTTNALDLAVVTPGSPVNTVSGLEQAYSTQLVQLSEVNGGNPIYISRPGYYYKIATADDGFQYVNTVGGEYKDTNIECIPRMLGCSDDAKLTQIADTSCDMYGGSVTGYASVQGDASRLCKYSCSSGKLSLTNDCIIVPSSCPQNTPLWDANTGKCVANQTTSTTTPTDYSMILIIGIILLLGIVVYMAFFKRK